MIKFRIVAAFRVFPLCFAKIGCLNRQNLTLLFLQGFSRSTDRSTEMHRPLNAVPRMAFARSWNREFCGSQDSSFI